MVLWLTGRQYAGYRWAVLFCELFVHVRTFSQLKRERETKRKRERERVVPFV